ncbi:MAG: FtsQ-type POTRA domain-containing protein [Desulfobacterales bacterium]|nr:FtsQ-type POTRA domain-containing protein [Desulfobacterales bacterium]
MLKRPDKIRQEKTVKKKKSLRKNKSKARQAEQRARVRNRLAMGIKTISGILVVPLMALLFIFTHDLVTQWDHFNAKTIQVTGNRHLTENQVLALAGIQRGQNILSVNLGLARKNLISHGWIVDAAVNRRLPDGLGIEIREHDAVAVLDLGPGFLMDARGQVFKKLGPGESDRLPVVSGLVYADIAVGKQPETPLMRAVVDLLEMSHGSAAMIPGMRLKKIQADRETGLTLTLAGRLATIKIGYDRYPEKLHMLRIVSQFTIKTENLATIESVDLNNTNRIVLGPVVPDTPLANNKEV